jgi:hypothetical protein
MVMPRKADAADPGPLPTEKRTRRPALPLSDRAAQIIRETASYADMSIEDVKEAIASSTVAGAKETMLESLICSVCRELTTKKDEARAKMRESIFLVDLPADGNSKKEENA